MKVGKLARWVSDTRGTKSSLNNVNQSKTRPATAAPLLSRVAVFLSALPAWISPRRPAGLAPPAGAEGRSAAGGGGGGRGGAIPGIGGGGGGGAAGAAIEGIGGGGGGAAGAELGPAPGIGGGGGGEGGAAAGAGADASGGGGAGATGELTAGGEAVVGLLSSIAESGRGGPIVPKRIEANWAALVPPGLSSSESSSSSSLSEPQPSSSGRFRDMGPVGADTAVALASWVMRWKGLVETSGWTGGAGGAGAAGAAGVLWVEDASEDCESILRYGLRLSVSAGGDTAAAADGVVFGSSS